MSMCRHNIEWGGAAHVSACLGTYDTCALKEAVRGSRLGVIGIERN